MIDDMAGSSTLQPERTEGPGGFVGPYKLLKELGEGGFGLVYEAEQTHPVKRRVALKVIKIGMDTRDFVARFEAERQVLALMDHPHIAKVFGAGASDDGRPYFVMELVKGEPIDSYCAKHKLSIPDRLQLFAQVCEAVQHAHSKGIIHRDLKPGNVLVSTQDDRPFAKVIDFGIAKAMGGRVGERTLYTEQGMLIGTPLYMSPEQAEGSADIDTRSDIYALGVILYQLLTSTTPIEADTLRRAAQGEVQRLIREVDPPRPSTRLEHSVDTLRQAANECQMSPQRLRNTVRGELDWIVMKSLEKERSRRYETASGFVQDVRRYLAGDPVQAAPPSAIYRVKKFVRRNQTIVGAAALILLSLLGGLTASVWQARIAQEQTRIAQEQYRIVKQRTESLERLAEFQESVAGWSVGDGRLDEAELLYRVAFVVRQGLHGQDHPLTLYAQENLGSTLMAQRRLNDALPVQRDLVSRSRVVFGTDHPMTTSRIKNLVAILDELGEKEEADALHHKAKSPEGPEPVWDARD